MHPQDWLDDFATKVGAGQGEAVAGLFGEECFWRDYLPFCWDLQTVEGTKAIARFASEKGPQTGFNSPVFEGEGEDGFFTFATNEGRGKGHIRLRGGKCLTLFTMLTDLEPAPIGDFGTGPFVLVVGGGQGGLALGAQLSDLGVPYLIVDKHPRVGDQWRSRYASLVLHDPVWYDHMPFVPFPDDWPVFTPKDQMGDWLEAYAEELELSISNGTELVGACYDEDAGHWSATLKKEGCDEVIHPSHIVFALGISGFPRVPEFEGRDFFEGEQMHSSAFQARAYMAGKRAVIIGANNSAHDIASELIAHGATPTLVQRSSTLVVRQADYCERILGPLYSREAIENGISTERADVLTASMPFRLLERAHKPLWDDIRVQQQPFYDRLTQAGFTLDFAEDGTGLGLKYRRTASGYYIDVGAADMVADGRIAVRSGSGVAKLTTNAVVLETGEALPADIVVYATGYGSMTDWVEALIDSETAAGVGPCWGYGSGTKGDPSPWTGELRNMWKPTAQQGLWFMGGNLSQARFYSRILGLQLRKLLRQEQACWR
ncbi:MAG: NAD(P)/FAD-dependent oxidoreductase [Pseudomonadota bacterium]